MCGTAEIAAYEDSFPGVSQIRLLLHHRYGESKYEGLNRPYLMKDVAMLPEGRTERLQETVEQNTALRCKIGG